MQPNLRGAAVLAAVAALGFAAVGCNSGSGTTTNNSGSSVNWNEPIAKVNDDPISRAQFYELLQTYTPNPQNPMSSMSAGHAVLGQLIQGKLICAFAKQEGAAPTDDQVNARLNDEKWVQESRAVKPFEQSLEDAGYSLDNFKQTMLIPTVCQHNVLTKGINVTDAEVKAYYEVNKAKQFTRPERAHIKRIVVSSKADADQILGDIKSGKQFESFVPTRSMYTTPSDGDLNGWIPLDSTADPASKPLVEAIKKANAGDVVPTPILFQGYYWLVKVVEKKPKEEAPLEAVSNIIRTTLQEQKVSQNPAAMTQFRTKFQDFQQKAKIEVSDNQYKDIVDMLKRPPTPPAAPPAPAPAPSGKAPAPPPVKMAPSKMAPSKP